MTSATLLQVQNLSVSYRSGARRSPVHAVRGVDLTLDRGQTVGLVGESGSGKSSVGSALMGLAPVSGGQVRFDGEDITAPSTERRRQLSRRMQVIFQDPAGSLNPARTVGDTVGEGLRYGQRLAAAAVRRAVADVLAEVGLTPATADRHPGELSGGQRQRVAIARAIIGDPSFVVCDEPVSALDLSVQAQVLNLLARLKRDRGLSYLFISHDLAVVRYLSDDIAVMYAGRIVERGPAPLIAQSPRHPYTQALLAAAPVPDPGQQRRNRLARQHQAASHPSAAPAPAGCPYAHRCPLADELCRSTAPQLLPLLDGRHVACHHHDRLSPASLDPIGHRQSTSDLPRVGTARSQEKVQP